nr:PQQ-like beta-propeller repeat protein [Pseudaestuariivita rosea]
MSFLTLIISACAEREERLEGERLDLRTPLSDDAAAPTDAQVNRAVPIRLPAQVNHSSWTHRNGNAQHQIQHPALDSSLSLAWSANIGAGETRRHRITADPVVAGGRIFTLDAKAGVAAHTTGGRSIWTRDLTPPSENEGEASGGGLAYENGRVFVTTGFGRLSALDAETGAVIWHQDLEAPATGAPTVARGLVYVVSENNVGWAINAENGRVRWQLPGTPTIANMVGGAAPAVNDQIVVFPFSSGDLLAAFRRGGIRRWGATVSGERQGRVYATVSDITGDPVIDGNTIYVGNQSGRIVALSAANGARLWTATEGAYSPVWPAGGSVFAVTDLGELVRLDASNGERIWGVSLPFYTRERERRRKGVFAHYGPVLAGGRLIVASNDGLIRSFNPVNGARIDEVRLPGGATTNPVVVGGTLYLVTDRGQLLAFR